MKAILIILCFFPILLSYSYGQKIVKVGAFNFYPCIFQDADNEIKGFYVDAFKEIEAEENIRFQYVYGSWNECLTRLKNGEIDLLTSVAYTEKRAEYMDYGSTPLLSVWGEVYVNPGSDIQNILDLEGKNIAVMKNDFNASNLLNITNKLSISCNYIYVNDYNQVFSLTATGKADAGVVNNTYGAPKYSEFKLRSTGIILYPFDIFLAVKKGENAELLETVDEYVSKWKNDRNSVYNIARQKWSHGKVGSIEVIPEWVERSLYIVLFAIVILIIFITLLRYKVSMATAKIKKGEMLLRMLQTAVESVNSSIVITDKEGLIEYANPYFSQLTGYGPDEYLGKNTNILKSGWHDDSFYQSLWSTIESGKTWKGEMYNRKKNGEFYWENTTISPIKNDENIITHYAAVKVDITQAKKNQAELIKAKETAEESDRLKTAFLHNISHEIRTPMNAICGFSDQLTIPDLSKEKQAFFSSIIKNSSNQLLSIITDILAIATIESGQEKAFFTSFCLNKLISETQAVYSTQADSKHLHFIVNKGLNDKQSNIISDEVRLNQVLNNLLTNAFKFTSNGSIELGYRLKENWLQFYVKDTGIGINEPNHDKIFERFVQAEDSIHVNYGGTGLGLAISKAYVELLGGSIWLESELGKGTTMYFSIPYTPADTEIQLPNGNKNYDKLTVLIAEDEEYNFLYLYELLKNKCSAIIHASNGKEAIEQYQENTDIGLILMDLKMPVLDGFTAARQIKAMHKNALIIAQSAYGMDEKPESYRAVFDDFISKPINSEELYSKINNCLAKNRHGNNQI